MSTSTSLLPAGWTAPALDERGSAPYRVLRTLHRGAIRRFVGACDDPAAAQADALRRVLHALRGTGLAERYAIEGVRDLADLRAAVPVRAYAADADLYRRAADGDPAAVTQDRVIGFVRTSGTTAEAKRLPVTASSERDTADAYAVWLAAMVREQPEIATGLALASYSADRDGGAGANTARVARRMPWLARLRYAVPPWVYGIDDADVRVYTALRIALARDVRSWTTANPSTVLAWCRALTRWRDELAADLADGTATRGPAAGLARAERVRLAPSLRRARLGADDRVGDLWGLAAVNCWKGGSAAFLVERLPAALGVSVPVREVGISASEGTIAIPLHSSWWGGVACAAGPVVELVPTDGGDAVGLADAEPGRDYRVVLSTTAGLLRYDLDDVVRVEGRWRRSPVLRFLRKGPDVMSVTGEKLTADQVVLAARAVLRAGVVGFAVGVEVGDPSTYELLVEGPVDADTAARFDAALAGLNEEYASKRRTDRLAPMRAVCLEPGTFHRYRASRLADGAADGQVKDLVLVHGDARDRLRAGWR